MDKADLIDAMVKAGRINETEAEKSLWGLAEAVKTGLANGERVVVPWIGNFSCIQRKPRTSRNPRTGREIGIPPRTSVKEKLNPAKK